MVEATGSVSVAKCHARFTIFYRASDVLLSIQAGEKLLPQFRHIACLV